jgi:hypothetical protein
MINTWEQLEQKFHDYFFNGESELRLSHLVRLKQKPNETVSEYIRRFRETRNKCYNLTIGDRDLAELAFTCLMMALRDRVEGQDFTDVNHLLQRALAQESRTKEHKVQNWFRENNVKEKLGVNYIGEDSASDNDVDVCVAEWVVMSREKPLTCSFLKPSPGRRDEMKFTFEVTKCDKLLDL